MTAREVVRWVLVSRTGGALISSGVAAVISASVTYAVVNKRLAKKYEDQAESDLIEVRAFYKQLAKDGAFANHGDAPSDVEENDIVDSEEELQIRAQKSAVEEATKIMTREGYIPYDQPSKIPTVNSEQVVEVTASIQKNIWDAQQAEYGIDLADVAKKKALGRPYIITDTEFINNELEWQERQLTWYEGDEVLADEVDDHIRDVDQLIDLTNLKFGTGTTDSNTVYIASSNTQTLFAVTRSTGSYAVEVMALDAEDVYPQAAGVRRMRPEV